MNKADFPTGTNPTSVAMGDFNGDGKLDLAVANQNCPNSNCKPSSVSILLGKPDGTFQAHVDYDLGGNTFAMAVTTGDFNGDGKLDLAVAAGSGISILLGNGDGTFGPSVNYATGNTPSSVVTGDFNADGKLDLAVTNSSDSTVSVLLGRGDGTFQPPINYTAGFITSTLITADFNGDSKLDLAVVNRQGNTVSILLGNGDGTFRAHVDYATGNFPQSVTAGDFNGDGKVDLAVANNNFGSNGSVSVLLGNGDGTFQPHVDYPTAGGAFSVITGDFNRDGELDLAVTDGGFGHGLSVLLGKGDGTFQTAVGYASGAGAEGLTTADVNGDGTSDLVVTNQIDNTVSILLGNGDGTFLAKHDYGTVPTSVSVSTADFNGDGKLDLAVTNVDSSSISVLLGNGDGTFQPRVDYATGNRPFSGTVGDFNRDSKLDLATANAVANSISILLGNGDGTFQAHVDFATGSIPFSLVAGDFNGDGKLDLAVANRDSSTVSILLGNGDGTFQPRVDFPAGLAPVSIAAADFNGDGKLDLATVNSQSDTVSILLGRGDGTFQPHVDYALPQPPFPAAITIGDFNGDHKLDLAVGTPTGVSILLGNGDGTFQAHVDYPTPFAATSIAVADLNGVGKVDLAVADGVLSILRGNGDGTFASHTDYATPFSANAVTTGDFRGAGGSDLAVTSASNSGSGASFVSVFLNTPVVALFPSNFSFSNQTVATTSMASSFLLSNPGSTPLAISSIAVSGDFAQTNTCSETVAVGTDCTVSVTFSPTARGKRTGAVTIMDNTPSSPQVIALTGTGIAPIVSLSSSSLVFANQNVGTTSGAQAVMLSNTGDAPLTITSIAVSPDYAQTSNCGNSVNVATNCTINVTFTPSAPGTRNGTITISDNASNSPQVISLTGTGIGPAVSLSATTLTFNNQTIGTISAGQTVTLSNTGNANLNLTSVTIAGSNSADFAQTNNCGGSVAAGMNCSITVTFTPAAIGTRTGTITINDNASDSPQVIGLSGTGIQVKTATALSSGLNPSFAGEAVTFTATVSVVAPGTGTPSGTVDFLDGTTTLATEVALSSSAQASFTTSSLAVGTHSVTARYGGSASFTPSTSSAISQTVNPAQPNVAATQTSLMVHAGRSVTLPLNISSRGTLGAPVAFACSGLPTGAQCLFNPASVAPASLPTTVTLTLTTTGLQILGSISEPGRRRDLPWYSLGLVLPVVVLLGGMGRRRKWSKWFPVGITILLLIVALQGCGGGSGSLTNVATVTPPGTYNVVVTASSGTTQNTVSISFMVQP